jgi:transcriptional regulator with XRE-family HTH domain
MPHKKPRSTSEAIRKTLADSGLTGYSIAKASGVSESTVGRTLRGNVPTLDTADRLLAALGLRLVIVPTKEGK